MKLNPDCIRDILLSIEETTDCDNSFVYESGKTHIQRLEKYSDDEVVYHLRQCNMAGLLVGYDFSFGRGYNEAEDLSPAGHEFLAKIRSNSIWGKTKSILSSIGTTSLDATIQVAGIVITEIVKSYIGIR